MLPTFIIGLREGLEAALIVGIVAAFLNQQGRRDALRRVWLGVAAAVLLCAGVGVALHVLGGELPEKQQEGLEAAIALLAVGLVTYMVVWMKRHSRDLRRQLHDATAGALAKGSTTALVLMAFLAVLREGFETAVFLLAAFNASVSPAAAGGGALLGLLVAVGLGYGIYVGGVHLNLSRFFRATGVVLVLVAAGLLASAAHSAAEAGLIAVGQQQVLDLAWLVRPGSVLASVLTGVLGWQPFPVLLEVVLYLAYLVPLAVYVLWPHRRPPAPVREAAVGATA